MSDTEQQAFNNHFEDPDILEIGDHAIKRGQTKYIDLTVARLYDYTELSLPMCIIRAKKPGPVVFLSGAVHGDEIIGTEVIKRLLQNKKLKILKGTLICIPIVNVFGFNSKSRYLPDRRDLNRCFPGSDKGSLSARLAAIFLEQVISKSHIGIDLHTGAVHRSNLPQIRACLDNPLTEELAIKFDAPVIINSKIRDGSIREAAEDHGVSILVFEGGEALRHDEKVIRMARRGIMRCLSHLGMVKHSHSETPDKTAFIAKSSYWIRADQSGTIRNFKSLGDFVEASTKIAVVSDVFSNHVSTVRAKTEGVIIGENRLPLVNQGDALFHVATFDKLDMELLPDDLPDFVD